MATNERTFFGHPWGLANLFGVEMWERFSFYGLQAILLYYLYYQTTDGGLGIDESIATAIVGAYGGLVYVAAIGGGWVADRVLGAERTLFYSAIIVMLGHVSLGLLPGILGLTVGLMLVALGSGGVKTTASTVLGGLYEEGDSRLDGGYSIFYMGINIGALFGPLVTGWMWGQAGFHWGFGMAAFGMAIGLIQYAVMRKDTIGAVGSTVLNPAPRSQILSVLGITLALVAVVVVLFTTGILKIGWLSNFVSIVGGIAAVLLFVQMYSSPKTTKTEKHRLLGFIPMFFASVMFWSIYQQQFTVIAIYSDQRLNRTFGGFEVSPAWVGSISPIFIIVFSGIFATMWLKLGERQPSTPMKYALSLMLTGLAAFIFIPFAGGGPNSTPFFAMVAILFLFTMAELMISPVGLSLASRLAPARFTTRMMSLQFLSLAVGTALSGTFAGYYDAGDAGAERTYFLVIGAAAILGGLVMVALRRGILTAFEGVQ